MTVEPAMPAPSPRRIPFPLVRTCGCLFLAICTLIFGGMMVWMNRALTMDPQRVLASAEEILPGARPLPGQVGLFAVESGGRRLAVLGDPGLARRTPGGDGAPAVLGLLALQTLGEEGPEEALGRLRGGLEDRGYYEEGMAVEVQGTAAFRLAGGEVPAAHRLLRSPDGAQATEYALALQGARGPVLVLFKAPHDPEAGARLEGFLQGLQGAAPVPGFPAAGSPAPGAPSPPAPALPEAESIPGPPVPGGSPGSPVPEGSP